MSNSINLIQKQTETNSKEVLSEKIKKISFGVLISVGLLSIVLFLLSYRFSIGYVRSQEDKLMRKMGAYEQLGSKVFLLNSRLGDISFLISSRLKINKTSDAIIGVTPANLRLVKYDMNAKGIEIQAESQALSDINDFLNSLLALNANKVFSSVKIDSLSANASGYQLHVFLN